MVHFPHLFTPMPKSTPVLSHSQVYNPVKGVWGELSAQDVVHPLPCFTPIHPSHAFSHKSVHTLLPYFQVYNPVKGVRGELSPQDVVHPLPCFTPIPPIPRSFTQVCPHPRPHAARCTTP